MKNFFGVFPEILWTFFSRCSILFNYTLKTLSGDKMAKKAAKKPVVASAKGKSKPKPKPGPKK